MEAIKELAIEFFKSASQKLGKSINHVPEDKWTWKPSESAKSAHEITAHIAVVNLAMADNIKNLKPMFSNSKELFAWMNAEESKYKSKDEILSLLEKSEKAVLDALSAVDASTLESSTVVSPFGERALKRFIFIPEGHTSDHASQIDYMQTIWGDTEFH
jgi:hypothetical protein